MPAQSVACGQHVAHDTVLCCLWTHPRSENVFNPFCGIVEMEHWSSFQTDELFVYGDMQHYYGDI